MFTWLVTEIRSGCPRWHSARGASRGSRPRDSWGSGAISRPPVPSPLHLSHLYTLIQNRKWLPLVSLFYSTKFRPRYSSVAESNLLQTRTRWSFRNRFVRTENQPRMALNRIGHMLCWHLRKHLGLLFSNWSLPAVPVAAALCSEAESPMDNSCPV